MKHFKHLKSGMSLIEVMIALAIFAIFGSSLFVMQQYVFERMMISQIKLFANLRMQEELIAYQIAIVKELSDCEHGSIEKSLEEKNNDFSFPDMTVTITTKSTLQTDQELEQSPFKDFKNLHLICVKAQDVENKDKVYDRMFVFTYIPEIEKLKS